MTKKYVFLVAGAVITAVVAAAWYFSRQQSAAEELVLYGNVDIRQVSLAFDGSERVVEMRVQEGDRVHGGQVLAKLDTRILLLQIMQAEARVSVQQQVLLRLKNGTRPEEVAQARAEVVAAQADADLATQQLKRLVDINQAEPEAVSQQDLDTARSRHQAALAQLENRKKALQLALIGPRQEDISEAQAQLEVYQAELALLKHQLSLAELKAPLDAVVRSRLLEPGDMASPERPAYALAITNPKWVRAYIKETDLGLIKPGMSASVRTDSYPEQPIEGHIGYISSVAEFTPKTVQTEDLRTSLVYEVRVYVDDPDDRLRLGMPATVHIPLAVGSSGKKHSVYP
jgi:HlyD family secretion protein